MRNLVKPLIPPIVTTLPPQKRLHLSASLLAVFIALVATATFAIMDMYLPTYAVNTKMGVGFGIGANLVGFGM